MIVTAKVTGAREVTVMLEGVGDRVHVRALRTMRQLAVRFQRYVKQYHLSGQTLGNITGNLRQSIGQMVTDLGSSIVMRVGVFGGPTEIYGRAHEFGVHKTVQVKAHMRRIKVERRAALRRDGTGRASQVGFVRAHSRVMDLPERSFLASSLRELAPAMVQVLADETADEVRA